MSIAYYLYGYDCMNKILIGDGRGAWSNWGLMDHEGPVINLSYLGYGQRKHVYLPPDLLELLYSRFCQANPSGTSLIMGDADDVIALQSHTAGELDKLYESGQALMIINIDKNDEGYPLLRPYLPELFEAETIQRLADDPWLDRALLGQAELDNIENGGIPGNLWVTKSARWSPEWREYCNHLLRDSKNRK